MTVLALDTEITTWNKGHPYDSRNRWVCYSYRSADGLDGVVYYDNPSYLEHLEKLVIHTRQIVGFNFKFDFHWFRKLGLDLRRRRIWDCQIAEFILSNQTNPFPSLEETAQKYGFGGKLDVIKTEYWDKGINTDEIPREILSEYAALDADLTLKIYYRQLELMSPAQIRLCNLMSQDLIILADMEHNGLLYDTQLCQQRAEEIDAKISEIKTKLTRIYPDIPINFNSNDHLSAFLYGGVVKEETKEHIGFYKTGLKAGQPKYANVIIEHQLPRLYTPLKGSEMAKEGNYAVDEGTLRKLKGKKETVNLLLELAKLEKLNGTYYKGFPSLNEKMYWPPGVLHGQFNQTTAATGRLSSSKPNLQNLADQVQDIFISRYYD